MAGKPFFNYQSSDADRAVEVARSADQTRVVIPQSLKFDWQLSLAWGDVYLLKWLWWRWKGSRPARTEVVVDGQKVRFTLHSVIADVPQHFTLKRRPSLSFRANKYEPGLFIDAPGDRCETVLEDLPPPLVNRLVDELSAALDRHPNVITD